MATPRIIPSVERFLQRDAIRALQDRFGRDATIAAARDEIEALRASLNLGASTPDDSSPAGTLDTEDALAAWLEGAVSARVRQDFASSLVPLINATGVVIHTNLGRAPLAESALRRVREVSEGYVNLEYDLATGRRGSRHVHAETLLARITGAEAAAVVNNNAAATLLLLSALASGREVLVSRGEIVEIGGGFRVPDIMAQSGATLREVGTTNKTRAADYAAAINERTGLILRVHPSNFRIEGFTERPSLEELVALGRQLQVPVAEDHGNGNLLAPPSGSMPGKTSASADDLLSGPNQTGATDPWEPTVQASIDAGCDVVCFSGDKLMGGPQAGILAGSRTLIERIRTHPLMRAFRVDKLTYAALEATLLEHLAGRASQTVPVLRSLTMTPEVIEQRAQRLGSQLAHVANLRCEIIDGFSTVGGGSAPGSKLPTRLLALTAEHESPDGLERRLRRLSPPVIARIEHDRVVLDLRSVLPEQDALLAGALQSLFMQAERDPLG